ncbi:MAG TPA: hypothetical protein VFG68_04135 [Fimbriiglobus sp.]|nr:hypothetical protein [Fimbriiglobus sp.]
MTTDPARPGDDDPAPEADGDGYAFADPEPPARLPVSLPPVDDAPARDPHELSLDEETRPRRRRRRRPADGDAEEPGGEPAEEPGERILRREEVQSPPNWWAVPVGLFAVGFALSLVPVGVLAAKSGASAGAGLFALMVVGFLVQLAAMTVLLMSVGHLFGIDYGPVVEAMVKLAAVVAVVDGLTAVFMQCSPLGLIPAALLGAGVFQYLFRLSIHEMLLSVAAMVGAAWVLNFVLFAIVADKAKKKDHPTGSRPHPRLVSS